MGESRIEASVLGGIWSDNDTFGGPFLAIAPWVLAGRVFDLSEGNSGTGGLVTTDLELGRVLL